MRRLALAMVLAGGMAAAMAGPAALAEETAPGGAPAAATEKPVPPPKVFTARFQGRFGGQGVPYTVTAGEMLLTDDAGEPVAAIWSTAYVRDGVEAAKRPVTFVFNGGPGSASIWLHMGLLGPKRVAVPSDADADDGAAPFALVDNPQAPLDLTDLVFIDPVGTGYSRVVGKGQTKDFWGLNQDRDSIVRFIRQWVTANRRWNAPKFIVGESFGTTRAAAVADALNEGGQNMALNGLVLVSQALDYAGSTSTPDNITSFVTYLPSMAAAARYHGRAGQGTDLKTWVAQARAFAVDRYLPALFKGSRLPAAEREAVAAELARFTGLSKEYVLRSDLRVMVPRFRKELLRDKGLALGQFDGRYTLAEPDLVADRPVLGDAASEATESAYTAALNSYFGETLKVEMDRPYLTGSEAAGRSWDWRTAPDGEGWEPSYVNTARALSDALRRNGRLRVLVANGYYDLVTPFFDAEYTLGRHDILADRVEMAYFEAGHMMYLHEPDLDALLAAIRAFLVKG
ncbi:S10 family peptidase [Rhodocista pekingensis]|uniref:S10 family peptidase n=1 Tax=Rhodocista pekingensis TaxID=201185 RepID=A0ABW2KWE4_9PROT